MKKVFDVTPNLLNRIMINPDVMVRKPVIKGTRITVQHVLRLLAQGAEYTEILSDYPHITQEDLYACLLFAQQIVDSSAWQSV